MALVTVAVLCPLTVRGIPASFNGENERPVIGMGVGFERGVGWGSVVDDGKLIVCACAGILSQVGAFGEECLHLLFFDEI